MNFKIEVRELGELKPERTALFKRLMPIDSNLISKDVITALKTAVTKDPTVEWRGAPAYFYRDVKQGTLNTRLLATFGDRMYSVKIEYKQTYR